MQTSAEEMLVGRLAKKECEVTSSESNWLNAMDG